MQVLLILYLVGFVLANYYEVLGIAKDASEKDVKSAYRQLSKKYHPDKNPGDEEAEKKFIEIGEAYEVLSDAEKRKLYDMYGKEGLENQARGQPAGGDPFQAFFGHHGGGMRRGNDLEASLDITLEQFYSGDTIPFQLNLQRKCSKCSATGSADGTMKKCGTCGGHGVTVVKLQLGPNMYQTIRQPCQECGGTGQIIANKCKVCRGAKVVRENVHFEVTVEPGMDRDGIITLKGEADQSPDFHPGNLNVRLRESSRDNKGWRRQGSNLIRKEPISLKEALHGGWSRTIQTFGNDKITISKPKGEVTHFGEVEVFQKMGFSNRNGKGNAYVEYVIVMPHKWSHDEL
ncbi:hypothetical protein CANCADRAFT_3284 [Tortispora caseinolytica NRRL Y-17796]|uniref:DnaJ-related protein SCJ1 n=1 Tax=Tortispora caseinolytica NRRL Y-17796 TaxID=767744 RepID=A0A1E4TA74_9ASCO|nr:hypothetical protein CANCADRAFT_3284 [Tortispora caseinolytica NRRL Y-17796]